MLVDLELSRCLWVGGASGEWVCGNRWPTSSGEGGPRSLANHQRNDAVELEWVSPTFIAQ